MAAAPGRLFLLFVLWPTWRVPGQPDPSTARRFSEHKLCADDECSMVMYSGEAVDDFRGPDCRFVNFKKGDLLYVYYKLEEASPELWAGTVGRSFGYFPKDSIKVTHEFTKEELQIPTDETDFVCFDGGKDDFDNYNVEELLGFLYDSATEDSDKAVEKAYQQVEEPPEVSQDSESEPEPGVANSEQNENVFSENTEDLEKHFQKNDPHANSQIDNAQGEQTSFEPFEEMLADTLKVPEGENNKTSNGYQISDEQEKIDAYKLLKKEMTLDLKTKFGSTADALLSDDETTRLVTSLDDDFDEELDADFYAFEKEVEENDDNFNELPLLTIIGEEDMKTPVESGVEKYSTDKKQNLNEEDKVEVTLSPGIKNDDKNILTTLGDNYFSTDKGGEKNTGVMEDSNSEEEKDDDKALFSDSKQRKPQTATDYINPESAEYGLFVETSQTDKEPEVDTELYIKGKEKDVQESMKNFMQDESDFKDKKQEDMITHISLQSNELNSLPATEKGKDTLKSAFEDDLKEEVIHISKESLYEEKPGEKILKDNLENKSVHESIGNLMTEEKNKRESLGIATLLSDNQHNASKDSMEEAGLVSTPTLHVHSVEHQPKEFQEGLALKTQNQPRFSSPDGTDFSREPEEELPVLGRNLSWQQERDMVATVRQINEKIGLSNKESKEEDSELVHPKPTQETKKIEKTKQTDPAEISGLHTGRLEVEEDYYPPEELLEDENAISAKQLKEHSGIWKNPDVNQQVLAKAILGTINPDPENKENKRMNMFWKILKKSETMAKGVDRMDKEPGSVEVGKEESSLVDEEVQRHFEDVPDEKNTQIPIIIEVFQDKDSDDLKKDNPEVHLNISGSAETANGEEISKEDHEDLAKLMDSKSQGTAFTDLEDDLFLQSPHTALKPELNDHEEDLPIISSFFKEEQSLQRFLKYFDVHKLEGMLEEMSLKLKSAQQESLPYNVEKVLDKVFRASESHILSVAERMLDNRLNENRNLGLKEENIFEEAAVLDDIQDLIYFVRYRHSTVAETPPLIIAPPLEEGWAGPIEEMQPFHEDNMSPRNIEDTPGEPRLLNQFITRDMDVSEVSLNSNTEKDVNREKKLETKVEEPARKTSLEDTILLIYSFMFNLTEKLIAELPDDVRPGPDFYGLPWKPVVLTTFVGIISFSVFFWRTIMAVKERTYQVTEQQIAEKVKSMMKENQELEQILLNYQQKIKEAKKYAEKTKKKNITLTDETINQKDKLKLLQEDIEALDERAKCLHGLLESEREQNIKNQELITENKQSIEKLEDVISMKTSELSEVQIALNEAKLNEEKVKSEYHRVQEENARLKKQKDQLQQEIKAWIKSHAELSEQIKSFEKSQKDLEEALTQKDDNINALTNCITQLNQLVCESESEGQDKGGEESDELANGEMGGEGDRKEKMKNKIKELMDVSRTQTTKSVLEEELKVLQLKLRDSMSTKDGLEDQIKKLEDDRNSLQSAKAGLEVECNTLKQKWEILSELYREKEMTLQKKLCQKEYEQKEQEQKLSAADEKVVSAAEEIKSYKRKIGEMEEELRKTERSFKIQIATCEKKAHDNWLKARVAERALTEEKGEAAILRHKLWEMAQKMAMLRDEPVIVKPMPGRPNIPNPPQRGPINQNGSFGPSPVSGGERSPPLTAEPPRRPLHATFNRRDVPRSEFWSLDGPLTRPRWSSEASGKHFASDPGCGPAPMNSSSRNSPPAKKMNDEGKVNMAMKGPPPFPGVPLMGPPVGGPPPVPIRYGMRPLLLGPPPFSPPFGPGIRPPFGIREFGPGVPPGKQDFDPREIFPGLAPFRPFGSFGVREYFIPSTRMPPPTHGPQDHSPSPAARDSIPSGSGNEPPPAAESSTEHCSQAPKQSL